MKNQISRGGASQKSNIYGGIAKKGGLEQPAVFRAKLGKRDRGGGGEGGERGGGGGGVFWREGGRDSIPMRTMVILPKKFKLLQR